MAIERENTYIYSWHEKSKGARGLRKELGIRSIKHNNSNYQGKKGHTVINWGSSDIPAPIIQAGRLINPPNVVNNCASKIKFFNIQKKNEGARIPEFTTDVNEALTWARKGIVVMARTNVRGHSGQGIVFFDENNLGSFLEAPLFVQYKKKLHEFRVHVAFDEVVDVQKKILRREDDNGQPLDKANIDTRIRTHNNGYIFARNDIQVPPDVTRQAIAGFRAVRGLHFGAVDVIWNEHEGKAYVLEINTAPGIEGTTLENYVKMFRANL